MLYSFPLLGYWSASNKTIRYNNFQLVILRGTHTCESFSARNITGSDLKWLIVIIEKRHNKDNLRLFKFRDIKQFCLIDTMAGQPVLQNVRETKKCVYYNGSKRTLPCLIN